MFKSGIPPTPGLSGSLCKRPLHRFGTRPSNTIVKWFSAAVQSLIGRPQRADAFWIARYSTFRSESGFGNAPRFRVTLRSVVLIRYQPLRAWRLPY